MNGPPRGDGAEGLKNLCRAICESGSSNIGIHLHIEVLKIIHNFWCRFIDFRQKVTICVIFFLLFIIDIIVLVEEPV